MTYKIKDLPDNERPRERLIKNGAMALSDAELLAIILRSGTANENVISLCTRLLKQYNLKKLSRITINALKTINGIGEAKACQILACFALGRRLAVLKQEKTSGIKTAKDIAKLMLPELQDLKKEHLVGVYLDARAKIIKKETIFIGSLDANIIHPREIFKVALLESAAAVILVHNHPSGDPHPSDSDIEITKQLVQAGEVMGVTLIDHIIIGNNKFVSLQEKGYI